MSKRTRVLCDHCGREIERQAYRAEVTAKVYTSISQHQNSYDYHVACWNAMKPDILNQDTADDSQSQTR